MTNTVEEVDQLNSLLREEIATLVEYEPVLQEPPVAVAADPRLLGRFAREHLHSIETLKAIIQSLGGLPAETMDGGDLPARGAAGSLPVFGDRASVGRLLDREQRGLESYKEALRSFEPQVRSVVESELIPRQREHVVTLSAMRSSMRFPG